MQVDVLFTGFPGQSDRGFLGWSSCVLLRPPQRPPMLFDTVGFNERITLVEKLARLGVRPDEVGTVFLSHFHFDHVANYGLFRNAGYYLHELEVEHIRRGRDPAIPYEMFDHLQQSVRLSILHGSEGTVQGLPWVHTPGHTPGLYSLFLEYGGERWVLASDAVKNRHELVTGTAAMAVDPESSAASIRKIRSRADIVVPGHDGLLSIYARGEEFTVRPVSGNRVKISTLAEDGSLSKVVFLDS